MFEGDEGLLQRLEAPAVTKRALGVGGSAKLAPPQFDINSDPTDLRKSKSAKKTDLRKSKSAKKQICVRVKVLKNRFA